MAEKLDLTIIILTYNSQFWLKKTLQTLKEFYLARTRSKVEVIVVDNNSTDDTVKMMRKEFRWAQLIVSPTNVGFAAGNNLALANVKSRYVMLMNSDVECTADSNFDVLMNFLDQYPKVGVISPRIEFTNGKLDLASHRGEPDLWASFTYFSRLDRFFPTIPLFSQYHLLYKNMDTIHEIDACSGAAMMVRTAAMAKVGLLDEQFFMYAEDLDWCKRFRDAGYTVIYHPEVKVIHHKYKSGIKSASQEIARKTHGHFYETMLQYYDKHYRSRYPRFVRSIVNSFVQLKKGAV